MDGGIAVVGREVEVVIEEVVSGRDGRGGRDRAIEPCIIELECRLTTSPLGY